MAHLFIEVTIVDHNTKMVINLDNISTFHSDDEGVGTMITLMERNETDDGHLVVFAKESYNDVKRAIGHFGVLFNPVQRS